MNIGSLYSKTKEKLEKIYMFIVKNFIFKGATNLRSQHPKSKPTLLSFATCVQVAHIRAALYVTLASSTKGEQKEENQNTTEVDREKGILVQSQYMFVFRSGYMLRQIDMWSSTITIASRAWPL